MDVFCYSLLASHFSKVSLIYYCRVTFSKTKPLPVVFQWYQCFRWIFQVASDTAPNVLSRHSGVCGVVVVGGE